MIPEKFNSALRRIIEQLISDGHIKYNICSITFGTQRMDTLTKFINNHDLGVKPLTKFLDAFGYDFYITAVAKDDDESKELIEKISTESLKDIQLIFNEYLENIEVLNASKKSQYAIVDEYAQDLIEKYSIKEE